MVFSSPPGRARLAAPVLMALIALAALTAAAAPALAEGPRAAAAGLPPAAAAEHRPPVAYTAPTDGAAGIRPDVTLIIGFDRQDPLFPRFRQQLEAGRFSVLLDGAPLEARYDAETARITAEHALLPRYTAHRVELRLKAALHNPRTPAGEAFTYAFGFTTGSDLHEPTHAAVDTLSPVGRAGEQAASISVRTWDDYGLPAEGALLSVALEERGARAPGSASAQGGPFSSTATVQVADTEAEEVAVTLRVTGPYADGRDDHAFTADVRFLPGTPASATIRATSGTLTPGEAARLEAALTDRYGNPTPGVTVRFASSNATARFDPGEAQTDTAGVAVTSVTATSGTVDLTLSGEGFRLGPESLTGRVSLAVEAPRAVTTKHLRLQGVTRGWVHWPNVYDVVARFEAAPGPVVLQQLSVTSNACWGIYGPDDALVLSGCLSTAYQSVPSIPLVRGTLPAAGTYTLRIHWGGQYGNVYDLDLAYPSY
ncbi:MAG: Ig-like domain-containing protein [Firmicutes bacterium]|nr:Ig-like domain-containing protein [Bacillota bacterium]